MDSLSRFHTNREKYKIIPQDIFRQKFARKLIFLQRKYVFRGKYKCCSSVLWCEHTARLFLYLTHQGLQQFFSLIYFKHSLGILELKSVFYISILLTKYNYFWNFSFLTVYIYLMKIVCQTDKK